jgi:ribose-phosphate pyrophosphokinase
MSATIYIAMPDNEALTDSLARFAHGEIGALETRSFPDGETYLRFAGEIANRSIAFISSFANPNAKIPPLIFAARAARDLGAKRVGLIAPYATCGRTHASSPARL